MPHRQPGIGLILGVATLVADQAAEPQSCWWAVIGQDTISRIERRRDLLLSTLRHYIQPIGGELDLVARFPNRPPILLDHIAQEPAAKGVQLLPSQSAHQAKRLHDGISITET